MLSAAGAGLLAALPASAFAPVATGRRARRPADRMVLRQRRTQPDLRHQPGHRQGRAGASGGPARRPQPRGRGSRQGARHRPLGAAEGLADPRPVRQHEGHLGCLAVPGRDGGDRAPHLPFAGSPYVVAQNGGAYFNVPDFMANQHRLETAADAEAFLSRLKAFAVQLDQENARLGADAEAGVTLPAVIMDKTLTQLKTLRDTPAAEMAMVAGSGPQDRREVGRRRLGRARRRHRRRRGQTRPDPPDRGVRGPAPERLDRRRRLAAAARRDASTTSASGATPPPPTPAPRSTRSACARSPRSRPRSIPS